MRLSKNKNEFGLQWQNLIIDTGRATLDDLRDAVTTLEDTDRTARQVLGGTHPTTVMVGRYLREARAALSARKMRICYPGYEEPSVAAAYLAS